MDQTALTAPEIAKATPTAPGKPRGPRDPREAAFASFLIQQNEARGGDMIVRLGGLFFLGCAALVVLLAIYGSLTA